MRDGPTESRRDPGARERLTVLWHVPLLFVLFFAIALGLQYTGLREPLIYDSTLLLDNTHSFARHDPLALLSVAPERPLVMLSFYMNYLLSGLAPHSFRLFNCACVAAAGVILALLNMTLLSVPGLRVAGSRTEHRAVSLFLGLVFVVHPLQSLVILYVWQRAAILACLFYFAGLLVYVSLRSGRVSATIPWYAGVSALLAAGMLCKENVVTLPAALLLAEIILFRRKPRELFKRLAVITVITIPALIAYTTALHGLHGPSTLEPRGVFNRLHYHYLMSGVSPLEVALTESRVLFAYLGMILMPFVHGVHLLRVETISTSLWNPPVTLAAIAGVIAVLGAGIRLARRHPLTAFGILFSLLSVVPELILDPKFLFFGHRAILPMAGVLIAIGQAILFLVVRLRASVPRWAYAAIVVVCSVVPLLFLGSVTYSMSKRWNPLTFWRDNYHRLPLTTEKAQTLTYLHVLVNYGGELVKSGDYAGAVEVFSRADKLDPNSHEVQANLGNAKFRQGRISDAIEHYEKAVSIRPDSDRAHIQLGDALSQLGKTSEAIRHYQRALQENPHSAAAHNRLGDILVKQGRHQEALKHYLKAVEIDPTFADAHTSIGNMQLARGKAAEALEHYRRVVEAKPDSAEAYNNLGAALMRLNRVDQARQSFEKAVELKTGYAKAHANLGMALLALRQSPKAIQHLDKAVSIEPSLARARIALGHAVQASGDVRRAAQEYRKALEAAPGMVEGHYSLANVMAKLGRLPEAVQHYQRALQINPAHYMAHARLGAVFLSRGDVGDAIEHLTKALALRPDLNEARRNLEKALRQAAGKAGER